MIRPYRLIAIIIALLSSFGFAAKAEFIPLIPTKTPVLTYVVDGDTIAVQIERTIEKVRLIGIDTPESRRNDRANLQAERSRRDVKTIIQMGKQAKEVFKGLLPKGTELRIEYDVQKRDKYGRLLAYVYTKDNTMINEEMLRLGYAQLLTIPPNVRYVERFRKALTKSRNDKRGLWASGGF